MDDLRFALSASSAALACAAVSAAGKPARPSPSPPNAFMLAEEFGAMRGPPNLLGHLTAKQRATVLGRGRRTVVYRGTTLFTQGDRHDGIFLIESGTIKVFYTAPSGREITLAYWYPGNFVGGPEVFGEGKHVWSGVAVRNSAVVALSGADLRGLVEQMPELSFGLIDGLVFKGKCYSALAQMLGTRSVGERLTLLLRSLCQLYGTVEDNALVIAAAYSQQDLANMVGATRQWVTVTLNRLEKDGILKLDKRRITVLRPDRLFHANAA
jgi:CRP/FNR family cyclic AMP-dependent transcriptional regulator